MPTERVVEVMCRCPRCMLGGIGEPDGTWRTKGTLAPSSLAAAMLTLAEAVMARDAYKQAKQNRHMSRVALNEYDTAIIAALAVVRNHPDYRATCPRCGKRLDPAVNGVHTCNPRRPA